MSSNRIRETARLDAARHDPLDAAAWHEDLQQARSRDDVISLLRSFVAAWPLEDLHRLPFACLPPPIDTPEDAVTYALKLAAFERDIGRPASAELARMSDVFTFAAFVIRRLSGAA